MRFNKGTLEKGSHKPRVRELVKCPFAVSARLNSSREKDRMAEAFAIVLREMQLTGRFNLGKWYMGGD